MVDINDEINKLIDAANRSFALSVLIVDDSPTMRKIIKDILQKVGQFDVVEAGNGLEALQKLSMKPVQLIISDWNMPQMNGIDFVRAVRSIDSYRTVPILMVTTVNSTKEVFEAVKLGINGYLIKPFKEEDLIQKIKAVFRYI